MGRTRFTLEIDVHTSDRALALDRRDEILDVLRKAGLTWLGSVDGTTVLLEDSRDATLRTKASDLYLRTRGMVEPTTIDNIARLLASWDNHRHNHLYYKTIVEEVAK